jgi:hypothetical protein
MTQPAPTIDRAAALLDTVARTSTTMPVAVRCLLAAELLCKAGAEPHPDGRADATDRELLRQALRMLAASTTPELDEVILEATHHALIAHAAAS